MLGSGRPGCMRRALARWIRCTSDQNAARSWTSKLEDKRALVTASRAGTETLTDLHLAHRRCLRRETESPTSAMQDVQAAPPDVHPAERAAGGGGSLLAAGVPASAPASGCVPASTPASI